MPSLMRFAACCGQAAYSSTPFGTPATPLRIGDPHSNDVFEHSGFAVRFSSRQLVDALAHGWILNDVDAFEEGDLPRRLWQVITTKPA